ncbi:5-oxoprolinase subunit PxpB [soil metagenome]
MGNIRFISLGDSALTVEFGNVISVELNDAAIALSNRLSQNPFPGFIESVPAYASTSIFFDISVVRRNFPGFPDAFQAVSSIVDQALENLETTASSPSRLVEIPVRFDPEAGPDLNIVAEQAGLSRESVIEIFTGTIYRVFMLGFLPGFSYMGEVDGRIAMPRKNTPRAVVPKGSVGIAGKQTGIYSLASPGGWQIIGRTAVDMFTPDYESPCMLRPGDNVRFMPC